MRELLQEVFGEVFWAVLPMVVLVLLLQFALLGLVVAELVRFLAGAFLVVAGLGLFMLGLRVGLLPMGEAIGSELPGFGSLWLLLGLTFLLGFLVTVAEPDVQVLTTQVDQVSQGEVGRWTLIPVVALGVGIFAALGVLRTVAGIPISIMMAGGYGLVLALSFFVPARYVAIAFDAGGVTTGPMAVPVILSLGLGVVTVLGGKSATSEGFGLVGLASIGPVLAVMLLGVAAG